MLFVLFGFAFISNIDQVNAFPLVDGQLCTGANFDDPVWHPDQCECPSAIPSWINSGAACTADPVITCDFNGNVINEWQNIIAYLVSSTPYAAMLTCADQSEVRTCNNIAGTGVLSWSYTYGSCTDGLPANCIFNGSVVAHGDTVTAYEDATVPFGSSCVSEVRTCNNWNLNGTYDYSSCVVESTDPSDCDLPRWGTISSGNTVTAYENNSVACGSTCVSESRLCADGTLEWSYTNQSCSVASCGSSGWWGGGSSTSTCQLDDLICVDGIYEENVWVNCRYGELWDICEVSSTWDDSGVDYNFTRIGSITNSPYSAELNLAYLYAYNMWITDMDNIFDANMEWNLIRSHMAKMLVERAVNVMWLEANTGIVCDFDDISWLEGQDLYDFVIDACQMWLMGLDNDWTPTSNFNPYDVVTRAQFGTVLSRAIWGDTYNGANPYYIDHLNALNTISVMNYITNPWMLELRWYVMLMLFRADEIIN